MNRKDKKEINYYKYTTFVLIAILLIAGLVFGLNFYKNEVYNKGFIMGRNNAVLSIINTINANGYITFTNDNQNLTLVSIEQLQKAREQTILEIMSYVEKEGYVSLYNNDSQIILVQYNQEANSTINN